MRCNLQPLRYKLKSMSEILIKEERLEHRQHAVRFTSSKTRDRTTKGKLWRTTSTTYLPTYLHLPTYPLVKRDTHILAHTILTPHKYKYASHTTASHDLHATDITQRPSPYTTFKGNQLLVTVKYSRLPK